MMRTATHQGHIGSKSDDSPHLCLRAVHHHSVPPPAPSPLPRDTRPPAGSLRFRQGDACAAKSLSILLRAVRLYGEASLALNAFSPRGGKEPPMKFAFLGYGVEENWDAMS